jgi:hypothetical protein
MNRNRCRQPQISRRKRSRSSLRPPLNNRMTSLKRLILPKELDLMRINSA